MLKTILKIYKKSPQSRALIVQLSLKSESNSQLYYKYMENYNKSSEYGKDLIFQFIKERMQEKGINQRGFGFK